VVGGARPASTAQDVVFISAQSAAPDLPASAAEQLTISLDRLAAALAGQAAGLADVVKVGLFYHQSLVDEERMLLQKLRGAFPEDRPPVVSVIPLHVIPHGALLQIEAVALRPGSQRGQARRAVAGMAAGEALPFSSVLRCDDLIFTGSHTSIDLQGATLHAGDISGQASATIANLRSAFEDVGADLTCVAKLNTYYVGTGTTADWSVAARIRSDAFRKPGPGATGVPVPGPYPAGILLRQEAIGVVRPDGRPAPRKTSWPAGVWDWPIPVSFEQGLRINGLIFTGGQIAASTTGEALFPGDLRSQTINVMGCISAILGGLGQNVDCLSKLTVYYATSGDPADLDSVMACVTPFFARGLPAVTAVPLARLGLTGIDVEIEGIGAV
jgi:enamine deaminase RidA (YjgF/YER057c/UK114 family)